MISSIVKIIILFIYTCILSIIGGLLLLTKNGDRKYYVIGVHWARTILKVCGIQVQIQGLEKIKDSRGIVYMANHASMFDVWSLQANMPGQLRFVAKKELTRIPIFGWIWVYSGNIPIDRKSPKGYIQSLEKARKTIEDGKCIILYPEGTRTKDGKMGEFKRGPFSVATKSNATIVPVTINGSYARSKKDSIIINPGLIILIVHDPIVLDKGDIGKEQEIEIMKRVHSIIASAYINQ